MEDIRTASARQSFAGRSGVGLIETVIAIGVVTILVIVVAGFSNTQRLQRHSQYLTLARQLLIEEVEALRSASFADLGNRTATSFIEVGYNSGNWSIQDPVNPRSSPYVYAAGSATGSANPSRQIVPVGRIGDATMELYFRARNESQASWRTGMYIRYHDTQNYYLISVSAAQITMVRVVEGVQTQLWTKAKAFSKDVWYSMRVTATGGAFTISINGSYETGAPINDNTFDQGLYALAALDGVTADFDDVFVSNITSNFWSFPAVTETVDQVASGWQRTGPEDLPSGSSSITITDLETGHSDIKEIQSLSNTIYINRLSVLP